MMEPTQVKLECMCCAKQFSLISWGEELELEEPAPPKCGQCSKETKDENKDKNAMQEVSKA
jgi:DNA-directed RNA polymerase subunit RPC12/RpoP